MILEARGQPCLGLEAGQLRVLRLMERSRRPRDRIHADVVVLQPFHLHQSRGARAGQAERQ